METKDETLPTAKSPTRKGKNSASAQKQVLPAGSSQAGAPLSLPCSLVRAAAADHSRASGGQAAGRRRACQGACWSWSVTHLLRSRSNGNA